MDQIRNGELIHGYVAKPEPREIDHFDDVIRHSYSREATFMNVVVVERFFPGRSVRFHNLSLTESTPGGATTIQLANKLELAEAIEDHCGFPADKVREAITDIALNADIYS